MTTAFKPQDISALVGTVVKQIDGNEGWMIGHKKDTGGTLYSLVSTKDGMITGGYTAKELADYLTKYLFEDRVSMTEVQINLRLPAKLLENFDLICKAKGQNRTIRLRQIMQEDIDTQAPIVAQELETLNKLRTELEAFKKIPKGRTQDKLKGW